MIRPGGCRSPSRTTARQIGHDAELGSFRGGLVARTCVMHSRQKLWLHGVVTRSLYGSRQMLHCPSDCGSAPDGWGGVAWSVRELAGGCARTVGGGAAAGGARPCAAAAWGPSGMIRPGGCRSRSRTTARQNGHGVSFRRGLVAMTRVMHSRQKLWLHSVVTRSLYGSRQMEHWRGEVSVGELVGGCARTDGSGATSTGGAVSATARNRAFSARRSISAMVSAGSGGAAAGGATVGVVDSTSECWRSTRAAAALFSDMP